MKKILATAFLFFVVVYSSHCQTAPAPMAADTVLLVLKIVNADKHDDFEKFLREIFIPGTSKLNPSDQQLFKQMRIFNPMKMQSDGTYSYFFLVKSPAVEDGDYYIKTWLTKMYGVDKATEYVKMFNDDITFGDIQMFKEYYLKD